ncbi:MAG: hypothetical protein ACKVTZ_08125 [Bacteroidia bacterium]
MIQHNKYIKIDQYIESAEQKIGILGVAFCIALIQYLMGLLYCSPLKFEPSAFGHFYKALSESPFSFESENPLRYRMFAPLLGYLVGLKGSLFVLIPVLFSLLLPTLLYHFYRKEKAYSPLEALIMSSIIAFSSVRFVHLFALWYVDPVYLFAVFLMFMNLHRPLLFTVSFAVALFSHESILFVLPPLLYQAHKEADVANQKQFPWKWVGIMVVFALYMLFRHWISLHAKVAFDTNFYFNRNTFKDSLQNTLPHLPLALFYSFKLLWMGVLWVWSTSEKGVEKRLIALFLLCVLAQFLIAYDTSRLINLIFPLILWCFERAREKLGTEKWVKWALILIGVNFLLGEYYICRTDVIAMPPYFLTYLLQLI